MEKSQRKYKKSDNVPLGPFELLYFENHVVVIKRDSVVERVCSDRVTKSPKQKGNVT